MQYTKTIGPFQLTYSGFDKDTRKLIYGFLQCDNKETKKVMESNMNEQSNNIVHAIYVVDRSGSMGTAVSNLDYETINRHYTKEKEFRRTDIVCDALLRTFEYNMLYAKNVRTTIITFDTNVETICENVQIDKNIYDNFKKTLVKKIIPRGGTDIRKAMLHCYETIYKLKEFRKNLNLTQNFKVFLLKNFVE